jgi:DNA-binding MarR family transcriptional regulator
MKPDKHRSDAERLYLFVQHVARRLRDVNAACGISSARFVVLVNLAFHGVNNLSALAASEGVSRPAMTRLIRDMERDGLVRRLADSTDGRGVLVEITKKGRDTLDRVRKEKMALVAAEIEPLDAAARRALRLVLDALKHLEEQP